MKIVADLQIPYLKEYFGHSGELILKPGRTLSREDVTDAELLLVRSVTSVGKALLSGTKIKFVGSVTTGTDHLDTTWLQQADIAWSNAAGSNALAVADYVYCVVASLSRQKWTCAGKKAAVIGAGRIGRLVMQRLTHLGFEVVVCDPLRAQIEPDFHSTPLQELTDLDLITLHVPLTHSGPHATWHMIDDIFLQKQKAGCVLINTSRGAVASTQALLHHGKRLHYCLDVWEDEPHINIELLKQAWLATPHIAGYSVQSKIRGTEMIYRVACEKNMLPPMPIPPITFPDQTADKALPISSEKQYWADTALHFFDPLAMTTTMKAALLSTTHPGQTFDALRHTLPLRKEIAWQLHAQCVAA